VGAGRQTETGYRVSARLHLSIDGGPEFAAAEILFHDRLIVALGDSFISGEGNPDVPSRIGREPPPGGREPPPDPVFARADWSGRLAPHQYRRATWWDEPCHRSLLSWPVLASATRAAREPREAVTLVHLGCSGATTGDIIKKGQRDLAGNGEDEPKEETQLAQLQALLAAAPSGKPRRPDHVLLSAGGNDIGFAGVIKALVLPTEYRLGSLAKAAVGALGGVVCPYRNSGPDLNALCALKPSAQKRLEGYLPGALETLSATIAKLEWGPVHHFQYPNPIVGEGNIPCDTQAPPNPPDIHRMGGFEAAMGLVPSLVQGSGYTWGFVLRHRREDDLFQNRELFPGAGCDFEAESRDSEICQGLWVHRRLNDSVEAQHRPGQWNVVAGHLRPILGHGLCRRTQDFPLGQPRVVAGRWSDGWHPRRLEAYSADNQRWFRTTNDSAVIQYGGPKRYYHGTVHPTLMAHPAPDRQRQRARAGALPAALLAARRLSAELLDGRPGAGRGGCSNIGRMRPRCCRSISTPAALADGAGGAGRGGWKSLRAFRTERRGEADARARADRRGRPLAASDFEAKGAAAAGGSGATPSRARMAVLTGTDHHRHAAQQLRAGLRPDRAGDPGPHPRSADAVRGRTRSGLLD
jgi:lysophospholipase L1-like esterase